MVRPTLTADGDTSAGSAGTQPLPARRRRRWRALAFFVCLPLLLFVVGFMAFVGGLSMAENPPDRKAEGIVVLTGGAARISDALGLLASGHGQRLLISGVYPQTRAQEIARLTPEHARWFNCCVDLDRSALNTVGNAIETRRWAVERQFKSLIVVTSNFHMPRAMAELRHQLPDVTLVPYPVVSERVRVDEWWSRPNSARLLLVEYAKYVAAVVRTRMANAIG
jgi:uncharacterized SAM-binding protein YcdF (DUF218 family)